jgi:hypothetical protein
MNSESKPAGWREKRSVLDEAFEISTMILDSAKFQKVLLPGGHARAFA